jgi:tRNA(Ile)-lysidine synthase TilS/MesJ
MNDLNPDSRVDKLAFYLQKAINKADRRFRLFEQGDRILVAVSGGKDSLTLLDLLQRRQATSRVRYALVAGHICSDSHCGRAVPLGWLGAWCAERDLTLALGDMAVAQDLATTDKSACFVCSWNRRKALFELARSLGCNKLAFGHHGDDMAETVLLNLLYAARIEGMAGKAAFFGGELTVIRPLLLIEERDIATYAQASQYPIQGEPCPAGADSQRAQIKRMLRELETGRHRIKRSIYRAVDRYDTAMKQAEWAHEALTHLEKEPAHD